MSDMIDRLSTIANEAGEQTASRLAAPEVTVALQAQIARGARRRRTATAALAGSVLAMAVAAFVVVPKLIQEPELVPATHREVVSTKDGLVTFDDGSMQVVTATGSIVDIPAPAANAPVFGIQDWSVACAATDPTALPPGWTAQFPDAAQLVTFGRPLFVDAEGYHNVTQGQVVHISPPYEETGFAFSADVDPAIAPFVVVTMNAYVLGADGAIQFFSSQLEAQPAIDYSGDHAAGTYTATITTKPDFGVDACPSVPSGTSTPTADELPRYMSVVLFLNDGEGHLSPLAEHNSWVTVVKEDS